MKSTAKQPTLKTIYQNTVVPKLKEKMGYKNIHQLPSLDKIVINVGINADADKAFIGEVFESIRKISGQRPVITKAKESISNFKLRKGMPNGIKVTLRGQKMYEFLYLLITIALPAVRDFRGLSNQLDGHGNYSIGISDYTIFPQIIVEAGRKNVGMDITIVTTSKTDTEAKEMLALMGMPFRRSSVVQKEQTQIES